MSTDDGVVLLLVGLAIVALLISVWAVVRHLPRRRSGIPAEIDTSFAFEGRNAPGHRVFI